MNHKNQLITGIAITAIVISAGAFYGGMTYQKSQAGLRGGQMGERRGNFNQGDRPVGRGGMMGPSNGGAGDFTAGEVLSKDDKSITIKTRDGGSKIIYFTAETMVGKSVNGNVSDLNTSQQVMVNGKNNPDGSFSAQNIQIRPE